MNSVMTEQQVFELLKRDDEYAFAWFFTRLNGSIYNYFIKLGADKELAQDLCQDVFKRLWFLRSVLKNARDLEALLFLMARYRYFDELRRVKTDMNARRSQAACSMREDEGRGKELESVCRKLLGEMERALSDLSPQRKRVLQLLYIDGLDVDSVARLLGLRPQTVRNTKTDALDFLRKRLSDRDLVSAGLLPVFLHYLEAL